MKRLIFILAAILLFLVFTYIYYKPAERHLTVSATTLNGKIVNVEFDIKYQKYFFFALCTFNVAEMLGTDAFFGLAERLMML